MVKMKSDDNVRLVNDPLKSAQKLHLSIKIAGFLTA